MTEDNKPTMEQKLTQALFENHAQRVLIGALIAAVGRQTDPDNPGDAARAIFADAIKMVEDGKFNNAGMPEEQDRAHRQVLINLVRSVGRFVPIDEPTKQ